MAHFGIAQYSSDDTNNYQLRMSQATFDASGLADGDPASPPYPHQWKPRKVHGVSDDGLHHSSLPVNEASDLWQGVTNTFTKTIDGAAITFSVSGRTGEKRPRLAQPF